MYLVLIMLAGCAPTPGQLKHEDFTWSNVRTTYGYQEAYRRIVEGLRMCGTPYDTVLYTDNNTGNFDIFLPAAWPLHHQRSAWVAGRINIYSLNNGTSAVNIGVVNMFDKPVFGEQGRIRRIWSGYLDRKFECL